MWTEIFTVLAIIIILYFAFYLGIKLRKHYYKTNEEYVRQEQANSNETTNKVLDTITSVAQF